MGIMALGMTFVIISGGIDLSVGSVQAFCAMVGAAVMLVISGYGINELQLNSLLPSAQLIGTFAGIIGGGFSGLLIGWVIIKVKIQPFIVTLGAMSLFRGIALVSNNGIPINVPSYQFLGGGDLYGIPVSILIFIFISVICYFILKHTFLGRYTYAIGSNETATYYAGVNVKKTKILIYLINGLLVGLAAMIGCSRTVSAQPTAGIGAELDVIAAVVLGGASLSGGRGSILGTLIGTLLIQFLRNGCTLIGISTNAQLIVIGIIIVVAVSVDQLVKKA